MANLLKLKDLIQDMIDKGATTVEQIHKSIAAMPLDALEKIEPLESAAQSTRKLQDTTIGGVYDIIRKVNKEVGKLAEEMLQGVDSLKDEGEGENY